MYLVVASVFFIKRSNCLDQICDNGAALVDALMCGQDVFPGVASSGVCGWAPGLTPGPEGSLTCKRVCGSSHCVLVLGDTEDISHTPGIMSVTLHPLSPLILLFFSKYNQDIFLLLLLLLLLF